MADFQLAPANILANPTIVSFGASTPYNLPTSAGTTVHATNTAAPPTARTMQIADYKTHIIYNTGTYDFILAWHGGSQTIKPGEIVMVSWSSATGAHVPMPMNVTAAASDVFEFEANALPVTPPPPPGVDVTPNAFTFTAINNAATSQVYTSNAMTVAGIDANYDFGQGTTPVGVPVTITGTGALYSINGQPFTATLGSAYLGDQIRVQIPASGTASTLVTATLTVGGVSGAFNVTTASSSPDITPNAFTFADVTGANPNQVYTSSIVIGGINAPVAFEVVGGRWSRNAQPFVNGLPSAGSGPSGTLNNSDTILLEVTASASYATATSSTLTVNGVTDTFSVTTMNAPAPDTTPDPFTFTDLSNVATSTLQTSNGITVAGINSPATVTVSGGSWIKNNGVPTTSSGTVVAGDTVQAQHTSSGSASTPTSTVVTIGGVSDTFTSTTAASGPASTTSLASPNWLVDAEDYAGTKLGVAYYVSNYQTQFAFEAGGGGTLATVSDTAGLNAAITAAKSDSTKKGINCNPGNYTWTRNSLGGLNRATTDCFVIRTTPGSGSQAVFSKITEDNTTFSGIAFVDLDVRAGLELQSNVIAQDILIERCTGDLTLQGQNLGSQTPGTAMKNVQIRLNTLCDHWGATSNALTHGIYMWNYQDVLVEGNILDHNGWNPAFRRSDGAASGPTNRKHNTYFNVPGSGLVIRYNWNSRASSHGWHMKHGGRLYRNINSRNPINCQLCYGADGNAGNYTRPTNVICRDNLMIGGQDILPNDTHGVGQWITWVNGGLYTRNRFLYGNINGSNVNRAVNYLEINFGIDATVSDNVVYQWDPWKLTRKTGTPANLSETGNVLSATSISGAAQSLAYDLGGAPWDPGLDSSSQADTFVANYRAARFRLGVDIAQLKTWMSTIVNGITP